MICHMVPILALTLLSVGCGISPMSKPAPPVKSVQQTSGSDTLVGVDVAVRVRCTDKGDLEYLDIQNNSTSQFTAVVSTVNVVTRDQALTKHWAGRSIARDDEIPPGGASEYDAPKGAGEDTALALVLPRLSISGESERGGRADFTTAEAGGGTIVFMGCNGSNEFDSGVVLLSTDFTAPGVSPPIHTNGG